MELYQRSQTETSAQNDPMAKELLRRAFDMTSRWGKDFPGFTAALTVNENGTESKGQVTIKSPKDVEVKVVTSAQDPAAAEELQKWLQNQVAMMAIHRAPRSFEDADGKYALTLGPEDHHPMGRQVIIHGDGMNSRYRIADDRIRQISRSMGPMKFTINIEEVMATSDGKFLTTEYVVFYFSPDDKLSNVESFTDRPFELKGTYLPGTRRVISSEKGAVVVRTLEFTGHRFL